MWTCSKVFQIACEIIATVHVCCIVEAEAAFFPFMHAATVICWTGSCVECTLHDMRKHQSNHALHVLACLSCCAALECVSAVGLFKGLINIEEECSMSLSGMKCLSKADVAHVSRVLEAIDWLLHTKRPAG